MCVCVSVCVCVCVAELFLAASSALLSMGSGTQAAMWPSEISARQRPLHSR